MLGRSCYWPCPLTREDNFLRKPSTIPHPTLLEVDKKPTARSDEGEMDSLGLLSNPTTPSSRKDRCLIGMFLSSTHLAPVPFLGLEITHHLSLPAALSVGSTAEHVNVQISSPFLKAPHKNPLSVTGDHRSQHWPRPAPHPNTICRSGRFLYTSNKSHHQPYQVTGPPSLCRPCSAPFCLGNHAQVSTRSPLALPLLPALLLDRKPLGRPRVYRDQPLPFLPHFIEHPQVLQTSLVVSPRPQRSHYVCLCELTSGTVSRKKWFICMLVPGTHREQ